MFYTLIPFLFTIVGAKPLYVGSSPMLAQALSGLNVQQLTQSSGLLSQPLEILYKLGNLEQFGTLPKGLLTSHLGGGQKLGGAGIPPIQAGLPFASAFPYPLTMALTPEKTIAGALIKQIPKVSKHPISVSLSPKSLELGSLEQLGALAAGLSAAPVLSGKSFINDLGLSFEY